MSKKSSQEIESLVEALLTRFQSAGTGVNDGWSLAAGFTRLGKIEFLDLSYQRLSASKTNLKRNTEEGLLIRIRNKRYSSAGIIESGICIADSELRIHVEHQSGMALDIEIPFRAKRPRLITLGTPKQSAAQQRWFLF